jgi:hypothetical protein
MAKDNKVRILVGTRKGTYVVEGDRRRSLMRAPRSTMWWPTRGIRATCTPQ